MAMPAGTYYVGDLCYVMDKEWDAVLRHIIDTASSRLIEGEFILDDRRRFALYSTKWGDGQYGSNIGATFGVDAGIIGVIRIDDILGLDRASVERLGAVVEFKTCFDHAGATYDSMGGRNRWDGVIRFGDVEIYTDPQDNYND
jgi:hypothetical protein